LLPLTGATALKPELEAESSEEPPSSELEEPDELDELDAMSLDPDDVWVATVCAAVVRASAR
jgi:hypothetical protein